MSVKRYLESMICLDQGLEDQRRAALKGYAALESKFRIATEALNKIKKLYRYSAFMDQSYSCREVDEIIMKALKEIEGVA